MVFTGERPEPLPTHSPTGESYEKLWHTAAQCWAKEAQSRPTMCEVHDNLCGNRSTFLGQVQENFEYGERSPASSSASFVTALEGDIDQDNPNPDSAISNFGDTSQNALELSLPPLPPSSTPPPLPLSLPRRRSSDTTEREWIIYTPVGYSTLRGQVKLPQGQARYGGAFSDIYQSEVLFQGDVETNLQVVSMPFKG